MKVKNIILFIVTLLGAIATVSLVPFATVAAAPSEVRVEGVVTDHGRPVAGQEVFVSCVTRVRISGTSGTNGVYVVTFTATQCPIGSLVRAIALSPDGKKRAAGSAIAQPITRIDITMVPISSIPEYGWTSGILAAGSGFGVIAYTRRQPYIRQLMGNLKR